MLQNRPAMPSEAMTSRPMPLASGHRTGSRVLRWFIASGMPLVFAFGIGLEHFAPEDYKPSTVFGGFWGHAEAVKIATQLQAAQANLAAQNEENARLQKQVADFQARTQRVSDAYKNLYDRTTIMAQAMAAQQQQFMNLRSEMIKQSQAGNLGVAQMGQIMAGFGMLTNNPELVQNGIATSHAFTQEAFNEADRQYKQGVEKSADITQTWQRGIPSVDQVDEIIRSGGGAPVPPQPHDAPPPVPAAYQPAAPQPADSPDYVAGYNARKQWEDWLAAQNPDTRRGAEWWAENRNNPDTRSRLTCNTAPNAEYRDGCEKAKTYLTKADANRKASPEWKRGWNAI